MDTLHPASRGYHAPFMCPAHRGRNSANERDVNSEFLTWISSIFDYKYAGSANFDESQKLGGTKPNVRRRKSSFVHSVCCDTCSLCSKCPCSSPAAPRRPGAFRDSGGTSPHISEPYMAPDKSWGRAPEKLFSQRNVLLLSFFLVILASNTDACSSRSTPKPRPPSPTMRPNITFQTYACPPAYAAWYCLNGATCFTVKIGISILYNCECADGFMGQRCEFKDLDGSYLPTRERLKMAVTSVRTAASSAPIGLVIIVVFVILAAVVFTKRRTRAKLKRIELERSEYSEEGDTSFQSTDFSTDLSADSSQERFWKETESSPPASAPTPTRSNNNNSPPSPRASCSLTPKFTKIYTSHPAAADQSTKVSSKSYLESPKQLANLSPIGDVHHRAFRPVYLPRESPRNSIFENSRLENLRTRFLENPRSVFGGKESQAVMNNTLSYKVESSWRNQVEI